MKHPKHPKHYINKKTLAQYIVQNNGLISKIAKQMNAPYPTIKNMIEKDEQLTSIINETKNITLDEAESQLIKKIKQGNLQAIKYYLDKQGGNRGYKDQQNINVNHKGGIVLMPATLNNQDWENSNKKQIPQKNQETQETIDVKNEKEAVENNNP